MVVMVGCSPRGLRVMLSSSQQRRPGQHRTSLLLCLYLSFCQLFYGMLMFMIQLGTLLVNSLPTLVLFDLSVSCSFVSKSFSRGFDMNI